MSTNPNSPLDPPSETTTARKGLYGNPLLSSSSVSLELANGEVIELEKLVRAADRRAVRAEGGRGAD